MGKVIFGMTISLDGFVADRNGDLRPLYPDLDALRQTEMLQESIRVTGAVVMGRRAYDLAQGDLTGYEYQTPIFVVTHHAPATAPKGQNEKLQVHFVTEGVQSAVAQAKAAAGDRDVTIIGGANIGQQCLRAGLVDELEIGIVSVLLGDGLRLFEPPGIPMELEKVKVYESPGRIDIQFRILKQ
ncbi:MAG TPA: dihydrofolate reductase family protein [Ktedonobacterales bacterium]|jgi:dihydrofolate reductase